MKKLISLAIALIFVLTISKSQTAIQLNGLDCNGVSHDVFADLDAGKAVLLHIFMPSCSSCPPSAKAIQTMANGILATYPGMITAYAMPYKDIYACSTTTNWISSNGLSLYAPYQKGATQAANYGGFGMPSIVLLGGTNHRVMFTINASTSGWVMNDTTIMKDSILALFGVTGIHESNSTVSSFNVFPNPANDKISINAELKENSNLLIDIIDITGKQVAIILEEKRKGALTTEYSTTKLPNGNYIVRLQVNGKITTQKISITH